MNHKTSFYFPIALFSSLNLIILSIITYWGVRFLGNYSLYYQSATQYFLFFLTHLTTLWVVLQISWLFHWSSKLVQPARKRGLRYLTLFYCLFVTTSVAWGLYRYYYLMGQQSSWMRFYNLHEQVMLVSIWLFSYISPLLLFLVLITYTARAYARKNNKPTLKQWTVLFVFCLTLLFAWGLALSSRDSYLLTQTQAMSGIYRNYSLLAVYNPVSALVALGKTLFSSPANLAETTSLIQVRFHAQSISGAGWPGFFPGLFYVRIITMFLISCLGVCLTFLIRNPSEAASD